MVRVTERQNAKKRQEVVYQTLKKKGAVHADKLWEIHSSLVEFFPDREKHSGALAELVKQGKIMGRERLSRKSIYVADTYLDELFRPRLEKEATNNRVVEKIETDITRFVQSGIPIDDLIREADRHSPTPGTRVRSGSRLKRNPALPILVKRKFNYRCQICGTMIPTKGGEPYIEVAHIIPLAAGGPDKSDNMATLCPNHHKEFDLGETKFGEKTNEWWQIWMNEKEYKLIFDPEHPIFNK